MTKKTTTFQPSSPSKTLSSNPLFNTSPTFNNLFFSLPLPPSSSTPTVNPSSSSSSSSPPSPSSLPLFNPPTLSSALFHTPPATSGKHQHLEPPFFRRVSSQPHPFNTSSPVSSPDTAFHFPSAPSSFYSSRVLCSPSTVSTTTSTTSPSPLLSPSLTNITQMPATSSPSTLTLNVPTNNSKTNPSPQLPSSPTTTTTTDSIRASIIAQAQAHHELILPPSQLETSSSSLPHSVPSFSSPTTRTTTPMFSTSNETNYPSSPSSLYSIGLLKKVWRSLQTQGSVTTVLLLDLFLELVSSSSSSPSSHEGDDTQNTDSSSPRDICIRSILSWILQDKVKTLNLSTKEGKMDLNLICSWMKLNLNKDQTVWLPTPMYNQLNDLVTNALSWLNEAQTDSNSSSSSKNHATTKSPTISSSSLSFEQTPSNSDSVPAETLFSSQMIHDLHTIASWSLSSTSFDASTCFSKESLNELENELRSTYSSLTSEFTQLSKAIDALSSTSGINYSFLYQEQQSLSKKVKDIKAQLDKLNQLKSSLHSDSHAFSSSPSVLSPPKVTSFASPTSSSSLSAETPFRETNKSSSSSVKVIVKLPPLSSSRLSKKRKTLYEEKEGLGQSMTWHSKASSSSSSTRSQVNGDLNNEVEASASMESSMRMEENELVLHPTSELNREPVLTQRVERRGRTRLQASKKRFIESRSKSSTQLTQPTTTVTGTDITNTSTQNPSSSSSITEPTTTTPSVTATRTSTTTTSSNKIPLTSLLSPMLTSSSTASTPTLAPNTTSTTTTPSSPTTFTSVLLGLPERQFFIGRKSKHGERTFWTFEEEKTLERALIKYGPQWRVIERHYGSQGNQLLSRFTSFQIKDKARTLRRQLLKAQLPLGVFGMAPH